MQHQQSFVLNHTSDTKWLLEDEEEPVVGWAEQSGLLGLLLGLVHRDTAALLPFLRDFSRKDAVDL